MTQAPTLTVRVTLPPWFSRLGVDRIMLAGLALVVIQVIWRGFVLSKGSFAHDDFNYVTLAYENGLDLDHLMTRYVGHLLPGVFLLSWGLVEIEPYSWAATAASTLIFQAWASLAMFALLRRMFGSRPGILIPLIIYLFGPLTLPAFVWWAAAVQMLPLQIAILMALLSHVRYLESGKIRHALYPVAWLIFGLAFFEKAVIIPVLLFAVTWFFFSGARFWRGFVRAFLSHVWLWLGYVALLGGYLAFFVTRDDPRTTAEAEPGVGKTIELIGHLIGETFAAAVVGGPLRWDVLPPADGLSTPATVLKLVAWAVIAVVVVASLVYRKRAARAWALLAGYLLFDVIAVVFGRATEIDLAGKISRYLADAAPVLAICVAAAFLPLRGEEEPYRRSLPAPQNRMLISGLALGGFVVMCVVSTQALVSDFKTEPIRDYLAEARRGLDRAPANADIYPTHVPNYVMGQDFGRDRLTSRLLAPMASDDLAQRMKNPRPSAQPYIFDYQGRLKRMTPYGALVGPPPASAKDLRPMKCFPARSGVITIPIRVDGGDAGVAGLSYSSRTPVSISVSVGTERQNLALPAGQGGIYFPAHAKVNEMTVTTAPGLCVMGASAGQPVPAR